MAPTRFCDSRTSAATARLGESARAVRVHDSCLTARRRPNASDVPRLASSDQSCIVYRELISIGSPILMSSRTHRIESSAGGLDGDGWLRRCDFADAIHRIDRWHRDSGLIESGASTWLAFSAALGVRDSCVGGRAPPCTTSPGALRQLGYGSKRTIMRAVHSTTVLPIYQCGPGLTLGTPTLPQPSDYDNIPRQRTRGEAANRGGSECNERRDAS